MQDLIFKTKYIESCFLCQKEFKQVVFVANVLDCNFVISEFKLQLHYYIHFWILTLDKGMQADKEKKQKVPRKNSYRCWLRQSHSDSSKYTQPSWNTTA